MKSPTGAVGAARVLYRDLERKMKEEGLDTATVKYGVAIAYASPDLTALGYTPLFREESQEVVLRTLEGNVPVGLLFGVRDPADQEQRVLVGSRPFLNTRQTDEWLSELAHVFPVEVIDPV
jgi:hypothetical protein